MNIPRLIVAGAVWAAALLIWTDALAPGSPVADITRPRPIATLTR